ncbi:MAG: endonuclease III [Chloroflexi bacterium]|nr:endonuclease III [Chloroflexota bacterium]
MDPKTSNQVPLILSTLVDHYGAPVWQNTLPPIDELICTILSQNTNDRNRDVAFSTLKKSFSSWEQVRVAAENEIVEAIRTAGLANQKGKNIKTALNEIYLERGNFDLSFLKEKPTEEARQWLLKFKGVGRKTAAIVLQFSLGLPAFPVDTHIYRVTGRLGVRPKKLSVEQTHPFMEKAADPKDYYAGHLNLIRLGREICHPHHPECIRCPLRKICQYPQGNPETSKS